MRARNEEEAVKGRLVCVGVLARGGGVPASFGRLDIASLSFGRGAKGEAEGGFLVAGGAKGLLLWAVGPRALALVGPFPGTL